MHDNISILMATYNGEKYLREQMESLLAQTRNDFTLCIRDDCSTDSTWDIITEYKSKHPNIIAERAETNSGGIANNFFELFERYSSDYVFLCDQDDVWLPDKIEKTLTVLKHEENRSGKDVPILAYADMVIVDGNLNIISTSHHAYLRCNPPDSSLNHLLVQGLIAGTTICYNRAFANIIRRSEFAILHDYWLPLIASSLAKIVSCDEALVLYRLHGTNNVGTKKVNSLSYCFRILLDWKQTKARMNKTYKQAEDFLNAYADMLSDEQKTLVGEYARIPKMSKLNRIRTLLKYKTLRTGFLQRAGQLLFV